MSDGLNRHLAPISPDGWAAIEDEARDTLKVTLAGRKLFDFEGPLGWKTSSIGLGEVSEVSSDGLGAGVQARARRSLPLVELRVPFSLTRETLQSIERGNEAPELGPVVEAAQQMGLAEDRLIFDGLTSAGIEGAMANAEHPALTIETDYNSYPRTVGLALETLRNAGIAGPYALALGPRCYTGLTTTSGPGGYPILEHVRKLVDGPIVHAPAISGALLLSQREGDFRIVVGRDLSIGYTSHSSDSVELYLEESLTFRLLNPEAAVPLRYTDDK